MVVWLRLGFGVLCFVGCFDFFVILCAVDYVSWVLGAVASVSLMVGFGICVMVLFGGLQFGVCVLLFCVLVCCFGVLYLIC